MALPYVPQTWADSPATTTPLSASRMGHIEDGLGDASDAIIALQNELDTGSAWTTYVPTWTNVNITGATVSAAYFQLGKFVSVRVRIELGTATPVSGSITLSLPVTAASAGSVASQTTLGNAVFRDTSPGTTVPAFVRYASTTTVSIAPSDNSTTYGAYMATSSTIPFTWASGDFIDARFTYEAA